jgi:hypothetical protein
MEWQLQRRNLRVAWALTGAVLVAAALIPASAFASTGEDSLASSPRSDWTPSYDRDEVEKSFQGSRTVPHWTSSFTDPTNQVAYPFTIVGSDPRLGGSTTVATVIVPLTFKFVAGNQDVSVLNIPPLGYVAAAQNVSMNGGDDVANTVASPIFTPSSFPISRDSGVQYGDAMMRAQFGKVGTDYHVTLGQPKILKAVTIEVPANKGVAIFNPHGVLTGIVDATWFKERLRHAIDERHVAPTTLPIFLSHNVFQYQDGNFLHCCSVGGHGAGSPTSTDPVSLDGKGRKPVHTFVFAAYITPGSFPQFPAPFAGLSDINSLSHEISEWMINPFGGNMVQPYRVPLAPPGTCGSELESGDVVAGVWFPMPGNPTPAAGGVWHPQDEAFLNWFARNGEASDLAPADGRFTYMGPYTVRIGGPFGAFGLPAEAC